jgi:pilus assembly protein CpaB
VRRRILILTAAAFLAMLSGIAVLVYAGNADRRALAGRQGTWVLLATATIPAHTTIAQIRSKRLARQVLMPVETVPSGAITKLDPAMNNLILNAPLLPDQMLLRGQFQLSTAPSATPTFQIPRNRLAVSIDLGIAPQVAGNVEPGDRVAVFCTSPITPLAGEKQTTAVLLPRVAVISIGEAPPATPSPSANASASASPSPSATASGAAAVLQRYVVTLAVAQHEADQLLECYHSGIPHLALIGPSATVHPEATVSSSGQAS